MKSTPTNKRRTKISFFKPTENDLFDAVLKGDSTRVENLLAKGLYVDVHNKGGNTPLLVASCCNKTAIVQILLNAGANVNYRSINDISVVIGHMAVVAIFGWFDLCPALSPCRKIER